MADKQLLYCKVWNLIVNRAAQHDVWWAIAAPYLFMEVNEKAQS